MKKLIAFAAALLVLCASVCAFAVPYSEVEVAASIEFEGITDADLGGQSEIIGDFDPHGTWSMTEGFVTVTEGNNGNGLLFTPNYANEGGYTTSVMRSAMPVISRDTEPWNTAWGLRVWINNTTDYDVTFTPIVSTAGPSGEEWVAGAGVGAYLISQDGEVTEADLDSGVNDCGVIVPYEFKGWIVLPFAIMGSDTDDYSCGWRPLPDWGDEVTTPGEFDFGKITKFAIDLRVSGFYSEDTAGIVVDSFEFIGTKGQEVDMPANTTPTKDPGQTQNVTNTPSCGLTLPAGAGTTAAGQSAALTTGAIIGIAAGAVVIIAAVIVIAIVVKKKKSADK